MAPFRLTDIVRDHARDHGQQPGDEEQLVRRGREGSAVLLVVCNFTPLVREGFRIGVPAPGTYRERLNTDSSWYW